MSFILVDSNVILDILTEDPHWFDWSFETLEHYRQKTELAINPIIFSEISIAFENERDLNQVTETFKKLPIPYSACFLAGKIFIAYKKQQGIQKKPLPDFFIGAHAAVTKVPLITRNIKRYQHYFPNVKLICPKKIH